MGVGMRQRCFISPFLFSVFMDDVKQEWIMMFSKGAEFKMDG